jgi:hypothetical protein
MQKALEMARFPHNRMVAFLDAEAALTVQDNHRKCSPA